MSPSSTCAYILYTSTVDAAAVRDAPAASVKHAVPAGLWNRACTGTGAPRRAFAQMQAKAAPSCRCRPVPWCCSFDSSGRFLRKEGRPVRKLKRFLLAVLANAAGTVLATLALRMIDL